MYSLGNISELTIETAACTTLGANRASPVMLLVDFLLPIDSYSQAKIALKASSEDELLELEAIAKSLNLCARSIQDMSVDSYIYSFG